MKKFILSLIGITITLVCMNNIYALSDEFLFVIDTVGIPRYNAYGDEINEEVYYTYNIFSYSSPSEITKNQRWKNSKYGWWTKNAGSYKGYGIRGEYYILGKSYSGAEIYNYYFPMDVIPNTTPDKWTFYTYPGAKASWEDTTKYKYEEQLAYMKNARLMFNDISSKEKADNPKYIKEYNITPIQIGLSKARLDTAATWKTYGMISTRRYISGVIYSQVYLVKPMAADANVESVLDVGESYVLDETEDELVIPINYETKVINMTGYADKKHIKEIKSSLYINNKKIDEISGSKIISVGNEYMLIITRSNYPPNKNYKIEISVDGYMHTEFAVDGLMQSKIKKQLDVYVEPKLIVPVKTTNLMIVEQDSKDWVVRPLAQQIYSSYETLGFTEAGKCLIAKLELNVPKEEIKNVQIYIDEQKLQNVHVYDTNKTFAIKFEVPKGIDATLYGEYTLRKIEGTYFNISKNDIGKRKSTPHTLKICFEYVEKEYATEMKFDTLDTYLTNVNTKITNNVTYSKDIIKLEDWIN